MAYTNSSLVTYKNITKNRTSPRNHVIDTITIHCIVGQRTAKQGCDYFASTDRQCSANYVVGKDGSIGLSVEEKDRSWCSSSSSNDNRAITIEVASDTTHPYAVTAQAYNALIKLVADICKRNGIKKLLWKADKSLVGQVSKQNMTVHRWFANKACPGDYLYERHGEIAEKVNALLGQTQQTTTPANPSSPSTTDTGKTIWDFLIGKGLNAYAVAGIMGNLQAESALNPQNLQNTYEKKLGYTDSTYTQAVDNGTYTNFVKDSAGYGLAQWTYWSRKQALLQYAQTAKKSIGDLAMQLEFLWKELQGYTSVMKTLKSATSIRQASDAILTGYEKPANQGESVKTKRAGYGQTFYDKYASTNTGTTGKSTLYRVRKTWADTKSQIGAYKVLDNAKKVADKNPGYSVFDESGNVVYSGGSTATTFTPYLVKVTTSVLNIRKGAGTSYGTNGSIRDMGVYTIVEEANGAGATKWGKLKSGAGWISLDYTKKV